MQSSGLRWALVIVPALTITLFDYIRHVVAPDQLHAWPGSVLFMALVVGGSIVITHGVFGFFERRRRDLLGLAGDLSALGAVTARSSGTQLDVLDAILERVLPSLPADAGAIYLLDRSESVLRRSAALGNDAAVAALPEQIDASDEAVGAALSSGSVRLRAQLPPAGGSAEGARRSAVLVPLRSRDIGLGLLVLVGGRQSAFQENLDLLAVLGSQVGVILDNLRLFQETQQLLEQSRYLAALEERDRLAREMHDSLAQVLSLVGIKARVIQELLNRKEYGAAAGEAADVAGTADAAYADVREAILGLRGSASQRGLVGSIRSYLQQFGRQSGLRTRLVVRPSAVTEFAPAAETQLIRVIQEALTNVRKHARATTAVVSFELDGRWARIVIEDDGQGFDPSQVESDGFRGFGLQTMAERVDGLGGTLAIDSRLGQGTRVVVRLPIDTDEAAPAGEEADVALCQPAQRASA